MSVDRDREDRYEFDDEEEPSRSIFGATWFRVVLAFVGLGVVGAVALPYLLGGGAPPGEKPTTVTAPAPLLDTKPAATLSPSSTPATSSGESPSTSGPVVAVTPPPKASAPPASAQVPEAAKPKTSPEAAKPKPSPEAAKPKTVVGAAPSTKAEPERVEPRATAKKDAPETAVQVGRAAARPTSAKTPPATRKTYWVQVGTFKDPEAARRLAARLREQKLPVSSRPVPIADAGEPLSRVRVGPFTDRATAASALRQLEAQGYKPFIARDTA